MSGTGLPSQEEHDEGLAALGRVARTHLTDHVTAAEEARGRQRFRASLAEGARSSRARRRASLGVGAAAVAAVAVLLFAVRPWAPRPLLTFEVDAPVVSEHDYLLVPSHAPSAHVAFSDGTKLTLSPGGRGRIVALHAEGAEFGLEDGKASLEVVHRPGARWSVAAGPFAIDVTGTVFDVSWSGSDEMFEVALRSGSVTIHGPLAQAGIALFTGQKLVADLRQGQLRIERLEPMAVGITSTVTEKQGTVTEPVRPEPGPLTQSARPKTPDNTPPSWTERVGAGDFRRVLEEAELRGLDATITEGSLADLVALADAARYAGRVDVARRALLAQRERFRGSGAAHTAAFLLGRLADAGGSRPGAAIGWYDRYLAETPDGEFASEALGRKLVAVERESGPKRARPIAEEYLRRFPEGPYAKKARALTLSP